MLKITINSPFLAHPLCGCMGGIFLTLAGRG